ncbi:MAG: hypothetical protein QM831_08730 [Kofleriaceae bacterium]
MVRRRTSGRKKRSTAYTGMGRANAASPARKNGLWVVVVLGVLVLINLYVFVWDKKTSVRAVAEQARNAQPTMQVPSAPLVAPTPAPVQAAPASDVIEGKVGPSDTLGKLLRHHGLSAGEADEVIRSLSGILDFKTIKAGQIFKISRANGRVQRFEITLGKGHVVHTDRQTSGELVAKSDVAAK